MTGRPPLADYHGRTIGYRRYGCKCDACLAAHRRAVTSWRIRSRAEQGGRAKDVPVVPQSVPADVVAAHIEALRAGGETLRAIAALAGVSPAAVARIARGDRERVRRSTAECILAVDPLPDDDAPDPVVVDRLVAGADWKAIGATRVERIAAAEKSWAYWGPIRRAEKAQGTSDQWLPGESLTAIERRLGLRSGRDFGRGEAVAS